MDVRFYDLSFNLLYILPQLSSDKGYVSCVLTKEFCDNGSFELTFCDEELEQMIINTDSSVLAKWNNQWAYVHSGNFESFTKKIIGTSLNGLLNRFVVTPRSWISTGISEIVRQATTTNAVYDQFRWLNFDFSSFNSTKKVEYAIDEPMAYDEFLKDVLAYDGGGWELVADEINKTFTLKVYSRTDNGLLLSEKNKNIYNVQYSQNYKEKFNRGWYLSKSTNEWNIIGDSSGIAQEDSICVLEATNITAAKKELAEKTGVRDIVADTQNLTYGKDYNVGDVIRLQYGGLTLTKFVKSVMMSLEDFYSETPEFAEIGGIKDGN